MCIFLAQQHRGYFHAGRVETTELQTKTNVNNDSVWHEDVGIALQRSGAVGRKENSITPSLALFYSEPQGHVGCLMSLSSEDVGMIQIRFDRQAVQGTML